MKIYNVLLFRALSPHIFVFLLLTLICTACTLSFGDRGNPVPKKGSSSAPSMSSGILLGKRTCPDVVKNAGFWKRVVVLNSDETVEQVMCGNLMGISALQAVVMVRHTGSDNLLDVSVYNETTNTHPVLIFALKGLPHGDAKISGYNTLLTAQIDANSRLNKGQSEANRVQDLYREFQWSDSARTLVQVTFPGIFPDMTRYQAEFEQGEVNAGQGFQQWRLSAVTTAQRFAEFLLQWSANTPVTVVSGGGTSDIKAVVSVKNVASNGRSITISLGRLERNANGGIWEVVDVETNGMSLPVPSNNQPLPSPISVQGKGIGVEGTIGTISVLDHLYTDIGHAQVQETNSSGQTAFRSSVSYTSSFSNGAQEGVLALYAYGASNHSIIGATMIKVLLGA